MPLNTERSPFNDLKQSARAKLEKVQDKSVSLSSPAKPHKTSVQGPGGA